MDNEEYSIIDYLILNGALEPAGMAPDGEPLYNFTPLLKNVMPELYEMHQNNINSQIMNLWEMGFVNLDLFAASPIVTLTEKAFNNEEISKLSEEDRFSVEEIKRVLLNQ